MTYTIKEAMQRFQMPRTTLMDLCRKHKLGKMINNPSGRRGRVKAFTEEDIDKIEEIIFGYNIAEEEIPDEEEEAHPLVTDRRWLVMGNWPNPIPKCFKEVE